MRVFKGVPAFWAGVVVGGLLLGGGAVVYSYTHTPNWIDDTSKYTNDTDKINVLSDIAPGGGTMMIEIGTRMNSINGAGKKKNWALVDYEIKEMGEAMEVLATTRPALESSLDAIQSGALADLQAAAASHSAGAFKQKYNALVTACNGCHAAQGKPFIVFKPNPSAALFR